MDTPIRLLIVEDDVIDQMAFRRMVETQNLPYACVIVGTVEAARQRIKEASFDVVILDYNLGDGTGFDLFDVIGETPFIFATGAGDEETAVKAMKRGAYDYLIKDSDRNYLKMLPLTIDNALRHHRSRQVLRESEEALKRYAERLEQSNQELEQFAYMVSHDLQEPLRTVKSFVQLLQKHYQGQLGAEADEIISFIVDGSNRMQALIQDLLALSRVGRHILEPQPVDVNAVLKSTLTGMHVTLTEAEATVTHDTLPTVDADATQLSLLLQNLVSNAVKFRGEASPRVHVWAERHHEGWRFGVRDNGIGIKPEFHERIFEVFRRLHSRSLYAGTGMGLAICKKIVERHGGRIWVALEPGQGTTFFFTIPA